MPRKRDLRPDFFTDDRIAECSVTARLLALALLTHVDREGRIENRAKKIGAICLPYDDVSVDNLLDELEAVNYLQRYEVEENETSIKVIQICNFVETQKIHPKEVPSNLPAALDHGKTRSDRVLQNKLKDKSYKIKALEGGCGGKPDPVASLDLAEVAPRVFLTAAEQADLSETYFEELQKFGLRTSPDVALEKFLQDFSRRKAKSRCAASTSSDMLNMRNWGFGAFFESITKQRSVKSRNSAIDAKTPPERSQRPDSKVFRATRPKASSNTISDLSDSPTLNGITARSSA